MKRTVMFVLVVFGLFLVGCATPTTAPTTAPTAAVVPTAAPSALDRVIEAAKKEGKLVVYASYDAPQAEKIHKAFNKKYPFIVFEHTMLGASAAATRVATESKAGTAGADVALTGVNFAWSLVKDKLLRQVDWASLGVSKGAIDGPYLVTVATITFPLTWNTKLVSDAQAPKTWEDMLNPKWKGVVGVWVSGEYFAYLVPAWGEAKVTDYVTKLMQNNPVVIPQQPSVFDLLAAGEVSLAIGGNEGVLYRAQQRGAPVSGIWADPVPAVRYDCLIPTLAPHPNAAMLYCAWLASPEGAAAYEEATGRGNAFVAGSPLADKLKGKQLSTFTVDEMDKATALIDKYVKMIQP